METQEQQVKKFIYKFAHDVSEPVGLIRSFAEIISEELDGDEHIDNRQMLQFISDASLRVSSLLTQIVQLLKFEFISPSTTFDPRESVDQVLKQLNYPQSYPNTRLELDEFPSLFWHKKAFDKILFELLSNALKFSSRSEDAKVSIAFSNRDQYHQFVISDNGIGIKPEHQEVIFTEFVRLNSRKYYPGNGLGLTFVDRLVNHFNGNIEVESAINAGSKFIVKLPKTVIENVE